MTKDSSGEAQREKITPLRHVAENLQATVKSADRESPKELRDCPIIVCMADVESKPVSWLWNEEYR